ncbi:MAG: bifunctional 4-hydroxy-2-oxoglutarate aldolase/2-dehydro-3-deoxy-phosphogluconate aldolase [Alphaproteobacteria bacterium]
MPAAELSARMRAICKRAVVIPAITIARAEDAVPVARALSAGGLAVIEIMLRSAAALEAIGAIAAEVPEAVVGAGTLLRPEDVAAAKAAGARFAVSPGAIAPLLDAAEAAELPLLPGAATASEAMALAARGWTMLKFFPAEASGGAAALGALAGPLPHIGWCPTGGVGRANAPAYRGLASVLCVGGSWPAPDDAVAAGDWGRIEALAREAAGV